MLKELYLNKARTSGAKDKKPRKKRGEGFRALTDEESKREGVTTGDWGVREKEERKSMHTNKHKYTSTNVLVTVLGLS